MTYEDHLVLLYKEAEKKEVERDRLYKKVGQLQLEVDWLKKKTGYLG